VNVIGGAEASLNGSILAAARLPGAAEREISTLGYGDVSQEVEASVQRLHKDDPYQEVDQGLLCG